MPQNTFIALLSNESASKGKNTRKYTNVKDISLFKVK